MFIEAGEAEEELKYVGPFIEPGWLRWREGDGAEARGGHEVGSTLELLGVDVEDDFVPGDKRNTARGGRGDYM